MSETLNITSSGRQERYRELLPQLKSLVEQEKDAIANIANVCAALSQAMGFFWVGCYRVYGNELLLGPSGATLPVRASVMARESAVPHGRSRPH